MTLKYNITDSKFSPEIIEDLKSAVCPMKWMGG
jgi:hypothetical protein